MCNIHQYLDLLPIMASSLQCSGHVPVEIQLFLSKSYQSFFGNFSLIYKLKLSLRLYCAYSLVYCGLKRSAPCLVDYLKLPSAFPCLDSKFPRVRIACSFILIPSSSLLLKSRFTGKVIDQKNKKEFHFGAQESKKQTVFQRKRIKIDIKTLKGYYQ